MTERIARWCLPVVALGLVVAYAAVHRPGRSMAESRFLMDTVLTVTLWGVSENEAERGFDAAFSALELVNDEMARVPGSPLWKLNEEGRGSVTPSMAEVLESSLDWSRRTRGAFDPTVAPLLDLWDILSGPHPPPSDEAVQRARTGVGWQQVRWTPATRDVELGSSRLDFGGIAKGYAIDRAAAALRSVGTENFLVNAGGDLYLAGRKGRASWKVGIQHPRHPGAFLRVVTPAEGAMVTSGDYERAYEWQGERIHHILDPRTGYPARDCQSVTVWSPTAIDADALATAVFVLGPEEGLALLESEPEAEGLVVAADGQLRETAGFARVAPERSPW